MDELGNAPKASDAVPSADSIELLVQQPCAAVMERLATIAEPFSLYAAMIPGERNRRVDFWIKITGNRFEAWPKARITSLVTTGSGSPYYRSTVRGEVILQPEGCLLKASINDGGLLPTARLARSVLPVIVTLALIVSLAKLLMSGLSPDSLKAVGAVAAFAIFVWGLFRLTLRQNKLAVANDRHHHRRFIELLRTTVLDTAHAAIESKNQSVANTTE